MIFIIIVMVMVLVVIINHQNPAQRFNYCHALHIQSLWLLLSNYSRQGAIVNCYFENGGDSMNEGGECGDATKHLQICLLRTEIGGWESGSS